MAERQAAVDALVQAAIPQLIEFGAKTREAPRLPENTTIGKAVLDALINVDEPDPDLLGVGTLIADGISATRTVSGDGRTNMVMVEVPGKGTWIFDGTTGNLINQ